MIASLRQCSAAPCGGGPYEPWQVVGAVLVLGVIAAMAGWLRRPWVAVVMNTLVMTVCFSVSAGIDPGDDGLWPVGAFIVAVATCAGVAVVAGAPIALARRAGSSQIRGRSGSGT